MEIIDKFGNDQNDFGKKKNDQPEENNDYPFIEDYYVEKFIRKFLIQNESEFLDTIDLKLILRAIPD